jgi:hypothetical protein
MAEVYELMMKLGLDHSGAMSGLGSVAAQLIAIQKLTGNIGGLIGGWTGALALAAGAIGAGLVIKSFESIIEAGGRVNHQLQLMKNMGMTSDEIAASVAQAQKTTFNVPTTSYEENLKHLKELRYAFGETTTAVQHLDEISKANSILSNIRGSGGPVGGDPVWDLVKSLEQKGLTYDPKEFSKYVDTMTKVVQATGGKVTPSDFMNTFKYGRTAMLGWDEEFIGGALPRLMQSMKGGGGGGGGITGPGNALMSVFAALHGKMTKPSNKEFEELGLGSPRFGGPLEGKDLALTNPYEWVQQVLMPSLKKAGITSQQDIITEINKLFGVRTASSIVAEMALQGRAMEGDKSPFEKDIKLQRGAIGVKGYDDSIKQDYPMIVAAFHAQWKSLLETIGSPLMAPGGPVMNAMSSMLTVMKTLTSIAPAIVIGMEDFGRAFNAVSGLGNTLSLLAAGFEKLFAVINAGGAALRWLDSLATGNALGKFEQWGRDKLYEHFHPTPEKQSFEGASPFGDARVIPANFNPSHDKKQILQPITLTLNLDGRQMGMAVSEVLEEMSEHPVGPPEANGYDHFRAMGSQTDT